MIMLVGSFIMCCLVSAATAAAAEGPPKLLCPKGKICPPVKWPTPCPKGKICPVPRPFPCQKGKICPVPRPIPCPKGKFCPVPRPFPCPKWICPVTRPRCPVMMSMGPTCSRRTLRCPSGYICFRGQCCKRRTAIRKCPKGLVSGNLCTRTKLCKPGYSCRRGRCCGNQCPKGLQQGSFCTNKRRCQPGFSCIKGVCCGKKIIIGLPSRCPFRQHEVPGKCGTGKLPRCPIGSMCYNGICCGLKLILPPGDDYALHIKCVEDCLPLFFAAKHHQYLRYGVTYLRMMERLPDSVREAFMKGHHTIHLRAGIWNGIWSDMGIETTWMKKGHGPDGCPRATGPVDRSKCPLLIPPSQCSRAGQCFGGMKCCRDECGRRRCERTVSFPSL